MVRGSIERFAAAWQKRRYAPVGRVSGRQADRPWRPQLRAGIRRDRGAVGAASRCLGSGLRHRGGARSPRLWLRHAGARPDLRHYPAGQPRLAGGDEAARPHLSPPGRVQGLQGHRLVRHGSPDVELRASRPGGAFAVHPETAPPRMSMAARWVAGSPAASTEPSECMSSSLALPVGDQAAGALDHRRRGRRSRRA